MSKLLDARTAGPWAHDPPGSGTVVSTVYRGRVVAQCDRLEDADAIARSYEEWPAALERIEQLETKLESSLNTSDALGADRDGLRSCLAGLVAEKQVAIEQARVAMADAFVVREMAQVLSKGTTELETRIAELERMLTAWQKHRHSPSLLADWTRYIKENSK